MIDSWETVAVAQAAGRNLRAAVAKGQQIVDRKNRELGAAYRKIAALEAELAELRGDRVARHRAVLLESLLQH